MKLPPIRLWIAVMIFFTTFTNYMLRSNISVSIIKMVVPKAKSFKPPCLETNITSSAKAADQGQQYDWNENHVGLILSAYSFGYLITSVPGGLLAELIGSWHVILWSNVAATILTALTPLCAEGGVAGAFANRFFIGLLGGLGYPAINNLIAKWAPPDEKGKFLSAMMGNTIGTVFSFNIVGFVTNLYGWPSGFYVLSVVMVIYCVAFALLVADSPDAHRCISDEEKTYIFESQAGHLSKKRALAPYKSILLSFRVWVLIAAQFGNLWGLFLLMTYGPKYMFEILGYKLNASAGLAALPSIGRMVASCVFGSIGDWMRAKEIMSVTNIRKFFIIFSHFAAGACLFLIIAAGCNPIPVVVLLVLSQAFNGAVVVGHLINPQDLAPNFAGSLYGVMNLFATSAGFIVPAITGLFYEGMGKTLEASQYIFSLGGLTACAGGVIFILFGTADVQPWNEIAEG